MGVPVDYKELFNRYLDVLHETKGVALKKIANDAGMKYSKLIAIRAGRSSAKLENVVALEAAYPDLVQKEEETPPQSIDELKAEILARIEALEKEVHQGMKPDREDELWRLIQENFPDVAAEAEKMYKKKGS